MKENEQVTAMRRVVHERWVADETKRLGAPPDPRDRITHWRGKVMAMSPDALREALGPSWNTMIPPPAPADTRGPHERPATLEEAAAWVRQRMPNLGAFQVMAQARALKGKPLPSDRPDAPREKPSAQEQWQRMAHERNEYQKQFRSE